jgi:hypothetical protein
MALLLIDAGIPIIDSKCIESAPQIVPLPSVLSATKVANTYATASV